MKYIKLFENKEVTNHDVIDSAKSSTVFYVKKIFDDLVEIPFNSIYKDIPIIDYMRETILGRYIRFRSIDRKNGNPVIFGKVLEVGYFEYRPEEVYISVLLDKNIEPQSDSHLNNEYLLSDVYLEVFDWEPGPLHKLLEIKKDAKRYNL